MSEQEVWVRAWVAVASSVGGKLPDCERYADECRRQFVARWPRPVPFGTTVSQGYVTGSCAPIVVKP